jgi:hypothetical protein
MARGPAAFREHELEPVRVARARAARTGAAALGDRASRASGRATRAGTGVRAALARATTCATCRRAPTRAADRRWARTCDTDTICVHYRNGVFEVVVSRWSVTAGTSHGERAANHGDAQGLEAHGSEAHSSEGANHFLVHHFLTVASHSSIKSPGVYTRRPRRPKYLSQSVRLVNVLQLRAQVALQRYVHNALSQ